METATRTTMEDSDSSMQRPGSRLAFRLVEDLQLTTNGCGCISAVKGVSTIQRLGVVDGRIGARGRSCMELNFVKKKNKTNRPSGWRDPVYHLV
jgi:hypothetical protein